MDWVAISAVSALAVALIAIIGAGAGYGTIRQKVADMGARMTRQDTQIDRLWTQVDTINHTNQAVTALQGAIETLTARMEAGHNLMLSKLEASDKLTGARMDSLTRAVKQSETSA